MTVNLSPFAGAGQQFFSDSGVPLSGGKLYSYLAGTTTPQATYTSASGSTAHTNPIVLNSAGRVATGEIWITSGIAYKFVLYTSTDVLIATWDNITGVATDAAVVSYTPAGTGAVVTNVQAKLRQVISVMDFGAVGDGTTDDSTAINNAIAYAGTLATNAAYVTVVFPAASYRVANSIIVKDWVRLSGYGAYLMGPITAYPRINSGTSIPAPSDLTSLTSGACFTETTMMTNPTDVSSSLNGAYFEGFRLENFRYGFASRGFAWTYPIIKDIFFSSIDIACITFNGAQMWHIINPTANFIGSLFVGAATAYVSGNPLASASNTSSFCDGLLIEGHGKGAVGIVTLPNVDSWFESAVLRPSTLSVTANGSHLYAPSTSTPTNLANSSVKVTGRAFYIPQRNTRLTFDLCIKNLHIILADRGYGLIANATNGEINHLRGEGFFQNASYTTECGVLVVNSNGSTSSISIYGIDTEFVTGSNYDSAVGVLQTNGPVQAYIKSITGKLNTAYFKYFSQLEYVNLNTNYTQSLSTIEIANTVAGNSTTYSRILSSAPFRKYDPTNDLSVLVRSFNCVFPGPANTETSVNIIMPLPEIRNGSYEPIQGLLQIIVRRLDTGVSDFSSLMLTMNGQNASTTLTGSVASGATVLPVINGVLFGPGAVIIVNAADNYVVRSVSGNNVTLYTPARNSYSAGNTVAGVSSIDRTITAFVNGIASLGFSGSNLRITNSLGAAIPVEVRGTFYYFGSSPV